MEHVVQHHLAMKDYLIESVRILIPLWCSIPFYLKWPTALETLSAMVSVVTCETIHGFAKIT